MLRFCLRMTLFHKVFQGSRLLDSKTLLRPSHFQYVACGRGPGVWGIFSFPESCGPGIVHTASTYVSLAKILMLLFNWKRGWRMQKKTLKLASRKQSLSPCVLQPAHVWGTLRPTQRLTHHWVPALSGSKFVISRPSDFSIKSRGGSLCSGDIWTKKSRCLSSKHISNIPECSRSSIIMWNSSLRKKEQKIWGTHWSPVMMGPAEQVKHPCSGPGGSSLGLACSLGEVPFSGYSLGLWSWLAGRGSLPITLHGRIVVLGAEEILLYISCFCKSWEPGIVL